MSKFLPFLPVIGPNVKFQPIYVGDVAQAITNVLSFKESFSNTYELGGPDKYTFYKLLSLMLDILERKRVLIKIVLQLNFRMSIVYL